MLYSIEQIINESLSIKAPINTLADKLVNNDWIQIYTSFSSFPLPIHQSRLKIIDWLIMQSRTSNYLRFDILQQRMSDQQASEQSEDYAERLRKKLKREEVTVNINPSTDITDLALARYEQIKQQHHFITFQEADKSKQYLTGKVEVHTIPLNDFNEEMYKFRNMGHCSNPDPTSKGLLFSSKHKMLKDLSELQGEVIDPNHKQFLSTLYASTTSRSKKEVTQKYKETREKGEGVLGYQGPWSGYGQNLYNGEITVEQKELLKKAEETKQSRIEQARIQERNFEPYSVFHWSEHHDYKNLSYIEPPTENKRNSGETCFLPKKEVHSWVGSQKQGFQVVRFFPKIGHFFLLGTPQGKVHLFDIVRTKTCARSYMGHTKAIRDVQFSHDGKHFLSASFDNKILYWDTEYGKVAATFTLKNIPFVVKFHPAENHPNVFFCGSNSKKIYQFDLLTGTKAMQYNQHLAAVNTLTFIEDHKFVSSSDDKKLFIWEYGVPVVTRHVSEPEMHTITSTAMYPTGEFFAGQSSDNQIVIYQNKGGNFRRLRAKKFASHYCAGYACAIDFSHDGQFLISGDERGKIYCYDWKTSKSYRVLDAHAGTCIGVEWHPTEPTTVVSCGWEGMVKLWQ